VGRFLLCVAFFQDCHFEVEERRLANLDKVHGVDDTTLMSSCSSQINSFADFKKKISELIRSTNHKANNGGGGGENSPRVSDGAAIRIDADKSRSGSIESGGCHCEGFGLLFKWEKLLRFLHFYLI